MRFNAHGAPVAAAPTIREQSDDFFYSPSTSNTWAKSFVEMLIKVNKIIIIITLLVECGYKI